MLFASLLHPVTERIDPSDKNQLLEFLRDLKPDKRFDKPLKLAMNLHEFEPKNREETFRETYKAFTERLQKRAQLAGDHQASEVKEANPLVALQAAPGGGKSYFLDLLAQLRKEDIQQYCNAQMPQKEKEKENEHQENEKEGNDDKGKEKEKAEGETIEGYFRQMRDILSHSIPICVSFNGKSPITDQEHKQQDMLGRLTLRMLHSYFFSDLPFTQFVTKCYSEMTSLPAFEDALQCIRNHWESLGKTGSSILLCVDELIRAAADLTPAEPKSPLSPEGIQKLVGLLHQACATLDKQGPEKLNLVVTTLDVAPIVGATTGSQRPVKWIPLPPLTQCSAEALFVPLLRKVPAVRRRELQLCIADCAGHPRTLESLFTILKESRVYLEHAKLPLILEQLSNQHALQLSAHGAPFEVVEVS